MLAFFKLFARRREPALPAHVSRPARNPDPDTRSTLPMDSWATSSMDLRDGMQIVELDDPPGADAARPH